MTKIIKLLNFLFLIPYFLTYSQTLEGTTGLFFIPTAEMQKDGTVLIGTNFVNKELISFSGYQQNALTPFISFTFLPFTEFSIKITRYVDSGVGDQALGDRTFSARIKINDEQNIMPAFVLGFHDIMAVFGGSEAIRNNALYLVGSKNVLLNSKLINSISFHTGYGLDVIKAQHHNFVGIFGGIALKFFNAVELMGEYDAERFNTGFRLTLFNHLKLLAGFLDMKHFSGGVGFSFQL
jgi:hypothetical protein